ncbi:MAG: tetratricopeptide repeat protein [Steroidobacteraceae bacterium]
MKNIRAILTLLSLNLALMTATALLPTSSVWAADEGKVSTKLGKPLTEAQEAGQNKQWDQALVKLREADAFAEKTAFDQFKINEMYAWVYVSQKKYGQAAEVYEKMLDSGFLSAAQTDQYTKQIAQMYMQVKNNGKAMEYLQRWLKSHPGDADMTAILGQLQYQSGQLRPAMDTLSDLVRSTERAGGRPKEDWLKLMYGIGYKLDQDRDNARPDRKGGGDGGDGGDGHRRGEGRSGLGERTLDVVEKLVRYYPSPAYWEALLAGLKQEQMPDPLRFQLDRLMLSVGTMKTPDEFIDLAQLAKNFGYPGEGLSALELGFSKGILGTGPGKDREERLKAVIAKDAETDKASLAALDKKARESSTGHDDAILGEVYMGYGQYSQAIEALERGIKKGGLKKPDEAQVALGIAYLRSNQADKARNAFSKVPNKSPLGRISDLWALYASSNR